MAVVVMLEWPGMTKVQYDKLLDLVNWDLDLPKGELFHIAWWESDTMSIVDLWESSADWQRFFDERVAPAFAAAGINGTPDPQIHEAYRYVNTESVRRSDFF